MGLLTQNGLDTVFYIKKIEMCTSIEFLNGHGLIA